MKLNKLRRLKFKKLKRLKLKKFKKPKLNKLKRRMENKMESFKQKGRLSRRFSSRKSLGSLKTRFKKFLSDHQAKAGEAEDDSSSSSDSDRGRKTASPSLDRSAEIKQFSSSNSSAESDEGSPSKQNEEEKSDSSSDSSSSEKKRKRDPSKSSRKKLQLLLEKDRHEPFGLPTLEETPPSSPQSNPRFSTGALSDAGRLWKHASAPNSPANLAHNLNLNYRGGDSSPVALIHSLSAKEPGKQASQLSEISIASPPSSSSLDLDALGGRDDISASPSKTTPSLKPNGLPIVHHDEEQGVWRCGSCGWIYPNPNPSLRNRREHNRHCGEITNVQRWLGAQDIQEAPGEGAVELEEDLEEWKGSSSEEKLTTADEHPMETFDREDSHESASDRSTDRPATVDHGGVDEIDSNELPEHHAFRDDGNDDKKSTAVEDPSNVEDQEKLNRVFESPTLANEIKDRSSSSSSKRPSNEPTKPHEIEDQSKLKDEFNGSTANDGIEEPQKLNDSVDKGSDRVDSPGGALKITPEAENEKEEPVESEADLEEVVESPQKFGSEVEAHDSQLNWKPEEKMENEVGDIQVQPVNGNGKLEESGQHNISQFHANGHDLVHGDNNTGLKEEEDDSANQDISNHLNDPDGTGVTQVPEIQSVLPSDNGRESRQGTDDLQSLREKDDLNNQTPTDSGSNEESGTGNEVENAEPGVSTDNSWPNYKAKVVKALEVTKPSLSTANIRDEKGQVGNRDPAAVPVPDAGDKIGKMEEQQRIETGSEKSGNNAIQAVAREVTKDGLVPKPPEPSYSQNGHLAKEEDVNYNGFEFPDDSTQARVKEIDSVEGNSTEVSGAQENDTRTESGERLAGPPSPLEEAPKWVNSDLMVNSQDDSDTFSTRQKYWADMTRSEYLLVEGKRSPSFGDDSGFPSFRIGEGRRSPSPFSLSKSEQGEIQSSSPVVSARSHGTVEENEDTRSPSPFSLIKYEQGEIQSSSPGVSVSYHSTVDDNTKEGRRSPSRFSLSKSEQGEIQSSPPLALASYHSTVKDSNEDRAIPNVAVVQDEGSSSSSTHVDYDFEQVVHKQITHDMICPVCGSDVTKRIILKKRKRTLVPEDDGRLPKAIMLQQGGGDQAQGLQTVDSDDDTWGCLACLSFFTRGERRVSKAMAPGAEGQQVQTEQEGVRCLPLPFRWRPWTSEPELREPLLPESAKEDPRAPEDAEEKKSYNCLPQLIPAFSWGPIPVVDNTYLPPSIDEDKDESLGILSSDQDIFGVVEGQQEAAAGRPTGEMSQRVSVDEGGTHEGPLDDDEQGSCLSYLEGLNQYPNGDDEQVSCFSYLHRSKMQLPADLKREKDVAELAKPIPVTVGHVHEVPLDYDEQVSCFSYLERANQYPKDSKVRLPLKPVAPETEGEESPLIVIDGLVQKGMRDSGLGAVEQRPSVKGEATEESSTPHLEAEIEDKAPTLSEQVGGNREVPDKEQASVVELLDGNGLSQPIANNATRESDDREKCECLPFFSFMSENSFSVHRVKDDTASPKESVQVNSGSSSVSPIRESHPVEDPNKEGGSDFLPASVPAFPLGMSSKYDLPPSPGVPSSEEEITSVIESHEEGAAGSATPSVTQKPQAQEDTEEKRSCHCLQELLPTFSWGPIPVYDVQFALDNDKSPGIPSSDQENITIVEGQQEATAGSPTTSLTQKSPPLKDAGEKRSCTCLPELLPTFSWGKIPVVDNTYLPPVEGQQETAGGSPKTSLTQESQTLEDTGEKRSSNCLPELLPAFSWRKIPAVDHTYLSPSIGGDDSTEGEASHSGKAGHIHEVPLDNEDSPDLKGKRVVDESGSSLGISKEEADDSVRPEVNVHGTPSHLETRSQEEATCMCLPVLFPAIHWGWNKTTTYENGLQEPLLPQGSGQGIEPPAAEPAPLEDSSLIDWKETTEIPEAVLLQGREENLEAQAAKPETPTYPVARVPEHSTSSVVDFEKGTHTTESEDLHFEGTVSSHKHVSETDLSGEVINSENDLESKYRFKVDIQDGHFTSTVEKLPPKLPHLEISNGEADSSTVSDSSISPARTSDEPEQVQLESSMVVPEGLGETGAEISGSQLDKHVAEAIAAQLDQENVVTSSGPVPKPVQTIISHTFPAGEIEDETKAKEILKEKSKLDYDSCNCLPLSVKTIRWWRPPRNEKVGEGLEEHLLAKVEENVDAADTVDTSVATNETHGKVQSGQPSAIEPTVPKREVPEDRTGERCNCLPSLPKFSLYDVFRDHHISPEQPLRGTEVDDIRAPLLGTTPPKTETVVNIDQIIDQTETNVTVSGPTTEETAAEAVAIAQNQSPSKGARTSQEYLKSIVHGGLDVTLVSLGVVASATGGDAKTITVIAIGLANLVFGLIKHLGTIMSLYYNNRPKFQEEIGEGFVHGCLSFISFLVFAALAPITYGFSFRHATNRDFKFGTTCVVALVSIVLLGAAQARVKSKSAVRVISILVVTGFVAAIAGYETGDYVAKLLKHFGFDSV